ncbi:hypothetical protein T492DRAFT_843230 [Pavlovales sp. CCMP2436]|nr:hypothetical protein T492DRAFT_843230 [Pavlovales sp. CCMP2436]
MPQRGQQVCTGRHGKTLSLRVVFLAATRRRTVQAAQRGGRRAVGSEQLRTRSIMEGFPKARVDACAPGPHAAQAAIMRRRKGENDGSIQGYIHRPTESWAPNFWEVRNSWEIWEVEEKILPGISQKFPAELFRVIDAGRASVPVSDFCSKRPTPKRSWRAGVGPEMLGWLHAWLLVMVHAVVYSGVAAALRAALAASCFAGVAVGVATAASTAAALCAVHAPFAVASMMVGDAAAAARVCSAATLHAALAISAAVPALPLVKRHTNWCRGILSISANGRWVEGWGP